MRVLHVSPSFFPAGRYGGPVYSGHQLCNRLAQLPGIELQVLTTDSDGAARLEVHENPTRLPEGYDVFYSRRWLRPDIAPGMFLRLSSLVRWAEVVHLTSVYSASTIPTLLLCRLQGKPVVWSTRGALQRWDGSTRAKIKSVWEKLCNLMCDRERVVLHVTSDAERSESLERIKNAGAVVIPNGIDLPESLCHDRESNETLRLLYLGRLHPIKGIENLLRAVSKSNREVRLSICGRGEPDYEHELRTIVNDLGLESRVTFQGQVEGRAKDEQFRDADLCVVPSFKENFCVVVAESLAHEVPVIASQGTPWQRLDEMGCGLCVENDADSLTRAIDRAALMPLREMGRRGRDWMKREYAWPAIAQQMADQYLAMIRATEERAATPRAKRQAA